MVSKSTYSIEKISLSRNFIELNDLRLPFDWKNPMGYTCAVAVQYMVGVCMFSIIGNLLSLGFGSFLFAVRATTDITANLELINKCVKTKRHRKKVLKYLADFVQYHADVKELSKFRVHFILI